MGSKEACQGSRFNVPYPRTMIPLKRAALICASVCACLPSNAQDGSIDPTFNASDIGNGNGDGANGQLQATIIQPDGKIIIGGHLNSYNGIARSGIARLNADGSLDGSFDPGTGAFMTSALLLVDEKIIIGGGFSEFNGTPRNGIARLNGDGSLDLSFDPGTGANNWVFSIAVAPDGKIVIGGSFTSYDGIARNHIARLNEDGSPDASFDPGAGANDRINSLAVQADGKVIIGGAFTSYNGSVHNHIARLNADGSLDTGFDPGSGCSEWVYSLILQPDGRIIIGGSFTSYDGVVRNHIARLNADGSLDTAFNPGSGADGAVITTALEPDGKIILGGYFDSYNGTGRHGVARLNDEGSLDTSFDPGSGADTPFSAAIQNDGKIILAGMFGSYNGTHCGRVVRVNTDGGFDTGFNLGTGASDIVNSIIVQPDGKIIIGGYFSWFNGSGCGHIARLNMDGSLDTSFDTGAGANGPISCIALQPDGKIIVGGGFTEFNGIPHYCLARLNADGSLDTGFGTGAGPDGWVMSAVLQDDGKIIVAGGFWNYDGIPRSYIARTNADGSLDTSFDPGTGATNWIRSASLQPDGKIVIAGDFYSYNGTSRYYVARVNSDGGLDASFDAGTGPSSQLFSAAIQPDGKVIIGGSFNNVGGIPFSGIARLNGDGSLDTSFDPGTGTGQDNGVRATTLQPDGKILIGGDFTSYDGLLRNYIARVNTDGSLDNSFEPGSGANEEIVTMALQANGAVIIGGAFTGYNGTGRNRVARLHNGLANAIPEMAAADVIVAPNPGNGSYTITYGTSRPVEITVTDPAGKQISVVRKPLPQANAFIIDIQDQAAGIYLLTLRGQDWRTTVRLVKQ
jgi:uncharacterized delta-60 repeat protein